MSNSLFKIGGLGMRQRNIIAGNLNPENKIEKALEFIKTEKEIHDALVEKLKQIEIEEQAIKKEMETLKTLIGSDPDEDATYYMYIGGKGKSIPYKRYSINYDGMKSSNEISLTNFNVTNKVKQTDSETLKRKYNDACYRYYSLEETEHKLENIKDNLNPKAKREHKLSEYELSQYGF